MVIDNAPLAMRFEIRTVTRLVPELKNANGYQSERAIPE
jgi:hypothetical protein